MRVSREQAVQNRERIVEAAAQLFRERGFDGIGVADLMKEAGLTHGGFYGHFSSKEELIAEASARALADSLAVWSKRAERASGDPLSAVASAYLTSRHRDNPGAGCLLAALGPDVSRHGPLVRRAVTGYVRSAVDLLTKLVPDKSKAARRQKATRARIVAMSAGQISAGDRGQRITRRTLRALAPDGKRTRQRAGRRLRDQFLLRGEVSVEPTMREPRLFHQIRDADPVEAPLAE